MKIITYFLVLLILVISLFSTDVNSRRMKKEEGKGKGKKDKKKENNGPNPSGGIQRNYTKNLKKYKPMKHSDYFLKTLDKNAIKKRVNQK